MTFFSLSYASLKELPFIAKFVVKMAEDYRIWLLDGDMGAGKTTFIKSVCQELGVSDTVQSPTFTLVNEYLTKTGQPCYHFDFYRIKSESEAYDIGSEEYFDSGNYCFIEWPSKIPSLIPARHLKISIKLDGQHGRILQLSKYE